MWLVLTGYPCGKNGIMCPAPQDPTIIIIPLLTKLVRSSWQDIGFVLFLCVLMDYESVSLLTDMQEKEYPAMLTSLGQ